MDFQFQFRGTGSQTGQPVLIPVPSTFVRLALERKDFPNGFPNAPKLGIIGMGLELLFVSERQHFVIYPGRIANAQNRNAAVYQLL